MANATTAKLKIRRDEVGEFHTPPACQGQVVERSYAEVPDRGVILECTRDGSDRSVEYRAYQATGRFDPWDDVPTLGKFVGDAELID